MLALSVAARGRYAVDVASTRTELIDAINNRNELPRCFICIRARSSEKQSPASLFINVIVPMDRSLRRSTIISLTDSNPEECHYAKPV